MSTARIALSRAASAGTGGRRPLLPRLWRARGGVTAVEIGLLLPVLLVFLLGIVEAGRALWTQTALQFAVEAAARCIAVSPSLCTVSGDTAQTTQAYQDYAASQAFGLSIPSSDFTITTNANSSGTCTGSAIGGTGGAMVAASYAFQPLLPQLVPLNVTLTACSYHP